MNLYIIILLSTILSIATLSCSKSGREEKEIVSSRGDRICIQVLKGQGDSGSNVVNFYFSGKDSKWKWFYVDHESTSSTWNVLLKEDLNKVCILKGSEVYAEYHIDTGLYFMHGTLHSRGEYELVGIPSEQNYPVKKMRVNIP